MLFTSPQTAENDRAQVTEHARRIRRLRNIWYSRHTVKWKMMTIFAFFSIASTLLVVCLSITLLNAVIRRETAYVIEGRIKMFVDNQNRLDGSLRSQSHGCNAHASDILAAARSTQMLRAANPNIPSRLAVLTGPASGARPVWLHTTDFAGIVDDRGNLGFTVLHALDQPDCSTVTLLRTFLIGAVLKQLSREAGVQITSSKPELLSPYRVKEGLLGEITANFIPGSHRPVPVVIVARNLQTGAPEIG
jgi:hypothetical protein